MDFNISGGKRYIYTRGVDRVYLTRPMGENFVLDGGDTIWRGWQDKVVSFIESRGGQATALKPTVLRPTGAGFKR